MQSFHGINLPLDSMPSHSEVAMLNDSLLPEAQHLA